MLSSERKLRYAAIAFAVVVLLHNGDHLRRGADATPRDVFWLGSLGIVIEVGVVALVFMRHRVAPLAAVAAGFVLAAGYVFVHFTPRRSWLSDAFPGGHVGALSWVAASLEVVAALVLGLAGLAVVRERGLAASAPRAPRHPGERPLRKALAHPVVAVMVLGNLAIFVASFAS